LNYVVHVASALPPPLLLLLFMLLQALGCQRAGSGMMLGCCASWTCAKFGGAGASAHSSLLYDSIA
jgi:hypothetical protein